MTTVPDMLSWLDAFFAADKELVDATSVLPWLPGFSRHERLVRYPVAAGGELRGELQVVGFPDAKELRFRISLLGNDSCICRLDYTDEKHPNHLADVLAGVVPPEVEGPHFHTWHLNRKFFETQVKPIKLHNAVPIEEHFRSFDAGLRWFCKETKIFQPPTNHAIELPRPERML